MDDYSILADLFVIRKSSFVIAFVVSLHAAHHGKFVLNNGYLLFVNGYLLFI